MQPSRRLDGAAGICAGISCRNLAGDVTGGLAPPGVRSETAHEAVQSKLAVTRKRGVNFGRCMGRAPSGRRLSHALSPAVVVNLVTESANSAFPSVLRARVKEIAGVRTRYG